MRGPLAPTTYEQRSPLYADAEALLEQGFLSHTVTLHGIKLALRSLNPGDLFLLRSRIGKGPTLEWKLWTIAQSVWLLDGFLVLNQPMVAVSLVAKLRQLPKNTLNILHSITTGLYNRQTKAVLAVEPYSYEPASRYHWIALRGSQGLNHSGVPGAEHLGRNAVQQMWAFFNEVEDQRRQEEVLWEGFKLSISPHAPKGIQKMDAKDKQRRKDEASKRQAVQDKFFYETLGLLKKPLKPTGDGAVTVAKSTEDLEAEMYRWVAGEDDAHDQVVKAYKQRIIDERVAEKADREKRLALLREQQLKIEEDIGPTRITGYSVEQLGEILKGRGDGKSGARRVQDAPPIQDYLYSKYLERGASAGLLKPEDGALKSTAEPGAPTQDLMGLLTNRQVGFSVGSEE
jgi:hypothetical protein